MKLDYTLDDGIGTRARLGLIVLQSDYTIENDMRRLLPTEGVSLLVSRVPNAVTIDPTTLAAMEDRLPEAAARFPADGAFDAVGYGCTSGTSTIGAEAVAAQVKRGCTTKAVTDPVTALIAACRTLGLARLALLTPYVAAVNVTLRSTLEAAGIATPVFGSFGEEVDARVARIAPAATEAAALKLAQEGGTDAIFMSCTNLRTLDIIPRIEAATGLPVLSSNQVLAWHLCALSGMTCESGFGRLTGTPIFT